jgi:hypothetical protein
MAVLRTVLVIVALEILTVIGALAIGESANTPTPSVQPPVDRAQAIASPGQRQFASQICSHPPGTSQSANRCSLCP